MKTTDGRDGEQKDESSELRTRVTALERMKEEMSERIDRLTALERPSEKVDELQQKLASTANQLEQYKKLCVCSICNGNIKNCLITRWVACRPAHV